MAEFDILDSRLGRLWRGLAQFITVGIISLLYRVRIFEKENVPLDGAILVLCNHQSFLDPMFSQSWVRRPFLFVARETLFRGFLGRLLHSLGAIPIRQGQADIRSIRTVIDLLKKGRAVCLYPEGSRTFDGRIAVIKPGFGLISRRARAPIVPMVIDGAFECWPRTRKWPRLTGRVGVLYGKPISPEHVEQAGDEAFAEELTALLRHMHNELRAKMGRPPLDYSTPVPTDW
ncbi:MAG TPA: lysophospholipid acyltransferase family protein [Anaerohalosphaeraceae bacterium]|nr:lysophospholipid acyltransferase family protein [Anaerohalosphaeraceae bacterium]HOL88363.1 lysophospholipid acyltransferase family protein [Anaerohalosphaeraceae bacterium]HPP55015.1 lysophospholipid acyltransferase family protein [Anaerohalosphaeraceae bacterium]